MATTTYKVLGQSNPAATTSTTLYTVPASTEAIVSTITVCNQAATPATFRVSISVAGAALSAKEYIAYDATVPGNGFVALTIGITLAATDVIRVYGSTANLSFSAFGSQVA
jgi:glucose-6-phosphate dehydrogenase assembly protein OpcA